MLGLNSTQMKTNEAALSTSVVRSSSMWARKGRTRLGHATLDGFLAASSLWLISSCSSTSEKTFEQLTEVARDWCQTVRASQMMPVYPLTEDVQPGDVFIVPLPLAEQAKALSAKGFLPLDQRLVRIRDLPFNEFYSDAYWKGTFAGGPHARPGTGDEEIVAPRVAFPSYTFSVDRSSGLQLALPVKGVPIGMGLLGADRATGSLTLDDAFTYGIDMASLEPLVRAWATMPESRRSLTGLSRGVVDEVYLRVITQVFLVRSVNVTLANASARSGGLDVGAAPELKLLQLSTEGGTSSAISAYKGAVEAIDQRLNDLNGGAGGGALRLAQATGRSISLNEEFDRPLVIGYQAFDVLVSKNGLLSAAIPAFTSLARESDGESIEYELAPLLFGWDQNSDLLDAWIELDSTNQDRIRRWLDSRGFDQVAVSDVLNGDEYWSVRTLAVKNFKLSPGE